jgi:hypothetical protein
VPRRIDRYPRLGPRSESSGPALPNPGAVLGTGQPVVGGTIVTALDGSAFDPNQRVDVVVLDGKIELARVAVDLAKMR